jgi:t-SNARE complex subunit (syntaxin)
MTDEQKLIIRAIKKQNEKIKKIEDELQELIDLVVVISEKNGIK